MWLIETASAVLQQSQGFRKTQQWLHSPINQRLEKTLNEVFAEEIADGDFDIMLNKALRIQLKRLPIGLSIRFDGNGFKRVYGIQGDVIITAKAQDFLELIRRKTDPDTLFFQRRMSIDGNTELGLTIKNILDAMDFERLPCVLKIFLALEKHWQKLTPKSNYNCY